MGSKWIPGGTRASSEDRDTEKGEDKRTEYQLTSCSDLFLLLWYSEIQVTWQVPTMEAIRADFALPTGNAENPIGAGIPRLHGQLRLYGIF